VTAEAYRQQAARIIQAAEEPAMPAIPPDPQLIADVEAIYHGPTSHRDLSPLPVIGTALPVPQPGRPPMSQKATDVSTVMLMGGLATVPPGLIAIGVLLASDYADPAVIGMICAAPKRSASARAPAMPSCGNQAAIARAMAAGDAAGSPFRRSSSSCNALAMSRTPSSSQAISGDPESAAHASATSGDSVRTGESFADRKPRNA